MRKRYSEEEKNRRSILAKELGYGKWMVGKKASAATRAKISAAHKGKPFSGTQSNWNGKTHTAEAKAKMAEAARGRVMSVETRRKLSIANRGANSPLWRGGITSDQYAIRHSLEYRLWHKAVLRRDDYTCQACSKRGGELEADHVMPFARYPDLRVEVLNGRTLCVPCHRKTPTYGSGLRDIL